MEAAAKYKITLTDYIDTLIHLGLERVEQLRREKALNKEAKNGEAVKQRAGDGQEEGGN